MRTTLTLDSDVAERLRQETRGGQMSLKKVVNERLRIGFGICPQARQKPFKVDPHPSGLRAGVDFARLNQLVEELEVEAGAVKVDRPTR